MRLQACVSMLLVYASDKETIQGVEFKLGSGWAGVGRAG